MAALAGGGTVARDLTPTATKEIGEGPCGAGSTDTTGQHGGGGGLWSEETTSDRW